MTTEMESAIDRREEVDLAADFAALIRFRDSANFLARSFRDEQSSRAYLLSKEALGAVAVAVESAIEDDLQPVINALSNALDEIDGAREREHEDIERSVARWRQSGGAR